MELGKIDKALAKPVGSERFEGDVANYLVFTPKDDAEPEILAVFFGPRSRTRPHAHIYDQVLHVLEGRCIVATDTARFELSPGEMIRIPAGTWHWHGATRDTPMVHLSIKRKGNDNWQDAGMTTWPAGYE